jgi:hypothetical protein
MTPEHRTEEALKELFWKSAQIVDARLVPKRVINYFLSNRVFLVLWFIWY